MASDISIANLIAYLNNTWNISVVAAPSSITSSPNKNPKSLLTIHRKTPALSYIAANVKQIDETFELMLSHPTEAAIDHLVDLLMAYPGTMTSCVAEGFETTNPFSVGALSTEQKYAGAKSVRFQRVPTTPTVWVFTTGAGDADYITLAVYMTITNDSGAQAFYLSPSATTNYFASVVRNQSDNKWMLHNVTNVSSFVSGTWYVFEFKNIDYTAKTFNLFINGAFIGNYAFFGTNTPAGTATLSVLNNAANDADVSMYFDAFQSGAATTLNRVPVSVSEIIYLGLDNAGNHVWTLQFKSTRWE